MKNLERLVRKKLIEQVIDPTADSDDIIDPVYDGGSLDDIEVYGGNDDIISIDYIYPNPFDFPDPDLDDPNELGGVYPLDYDYYDGNFPMYGDLSCTAYGCMDESAYNYNSNAGPHPWCNTFCHYTEPISFYQQNYNDEAYACIDMGYEVGGNFYGCYVLDGFSYQPAMGGELIQNYVVQCCQEQVQTCSSMYGCQGSIDPNQIDIIEIVPSGPDLENCSPENSGCRHPQWANFSPDHVCDCAGNYIGEWAGPGSFAGNTDCCNNDRCNTGQGPLWPESQACKDGNTIGGSGPTCGGQFSGTGCKDPEATNYCECCLNHNASMCEYRGDTEGLISVPDSFTPSIPVTPQPEEDDSFVPVFDRITPDWENPEDKTPRKPEVSKIEPKKPEVSNVYSGDTKSNNTIKKEKEPMKKDMREQTLNQGAGVNTQTISGGECAGDTIPNYTVTPGDYGSLMSAFVHLVNNYGMSADFRDYAFPTTNGGYVNLEIDINMGGNMEQYFSIEEIHESFGTGPFTTVQALLSSQNYIGGSVSLGALLCTGVDGVDNSLPTVGLDSTGMGDGPGMPETPNKSKRMKKGLREEFTRMKTMWNYKI